MRPRALLVRARSSGRRYCPCDRMDGGAPSSLAVGLPWESAQLRSDKMPEALWTCATDKLQYCNGVAAMGSSKKDRRGLRNAHDPVFFEVGTASELFQFLQAIQTPLRQERQQTQLPRLQRLVRIHQVVQKLHVLGNHPGPLVQR